MIYRLASIPTRIISIVARSSECSIGSVDTIGVSANRQLNFSIMTPWIRPAAPKSKNRAGRRNPENLQKHFSSTRAEELKRQEAS